MPNKTCDGHNNKYYYVIYLPYHSLDLKEKRYFAIVNCMWQNIPIINSRTEEAKAGGFIFSFIDLFILELVGLDREPLTGKKKTNNNIKNKTKKKYFVKGGENANYYYLSHLYVGNVE